ncbi:MAG: right-handed parallel beta-helix repeat-containing protein, partial [Deltaproteobacteria bacterium]|nr:right-handed parallel beta-helix repeat-containing protein [Deltaproteobacteria bacterium]
NVQWTGRIARSEGDRATWSYCRIHGNYNGPATDAAGLGIDDGDDVVVEYCTIWGVHGDCIIVDDTPPTPLSTVIRYNTLYTTLGPCAENGVDMKVGGTAGNPALIHDNTLYGFRSCTGTCGGSGNPRGEAIGVRNDGDHVEIYNNEIYDCSTAIVLDDNVDDIEVYRNVIHDMANPADDTHADSLSAFWIRARNADIYHNTVDNVPGDSVYIYSATNVTIENNIFHDCGGVTGETLSGYSADYNLWSGCTETLP